MLLQGVTFFIFLPPSIDIAKSWDVKIATRVRSVDPLGPEEGQAGASWHYAKRHWCWEVLAAAYSTLHEISISGVSNTKVYRTLLFYPKAFRAQTWEFSTHQCSLASQLRPFRGLR